jgi:hypothetical protein
MRLHDLSCRGVDEAHFDSYYTGVGRNSKTPRRRSGSYANPNAPAAGSLIELRD